MTRSEAYDKIDRFLRNNLDDTDYAAFSDALEVLFAVPDGTCAHNKATYGDPVRCTACGATLNGDGTWSKGD